MSFASTKDAAINRGRAAETAHRRSGLLSWKALLFILIVLVPGILAAGYYYFVAADQYVTEFRFNLRNASNPLPQSGQGISLGMAGVNPAVIWDSHAVVQFIKSREIVDDLQKKIGLRKIYANPRADFLMRLDPDEPIEKMTDYWQDMVDPYFDMNTGIITVRVRAFTPKESQLVAASILAQSEALINDMTERARQDALRYFTDEVGQAAGALHDTDAQIGDIRNKYGLLDPNRSAGLSDMMQSRQQEELSTLNARYESLLHSVGPDSPLLPALKNEIVAARAELYREQVSATGSSKAPDNRGSLTMSAVLAQYDALLRELALREKAFSSAQEALQRARIDFDRQQLYLNAFEHPAMPEMSTYPRRLRSTLIVFAFALLAWILTCLGVYAVHDHV